MHGIRYTASRPSAFWLSPASPSSAPPTAHGARCRAVCRLQTRRDAPSPGPIEEKCIHRTRGTQEGSLLPQGVAAYAGSPRLHADLGAAGRLLRCSGNSSATPRAATSIHRTGRPPPLPFQPLDPPLFLLLPVLPGPFPS